MMPAVCSGRSLLCRACQIPLLSFHLNKPKHSSRLPAECLPWKGMQLDVAGAMQIHLALLRKQRRLRPFIFRLQRAMASALACSCSREMRPACLSATHSGHPSSYVWTASMCLLKVLWDHCRLGCTENSTKSRFCLFRGETSSHDDATPDSFDNGQLVSQLLQKDPAWIKYSNSVFRCQAMMQICHQ